MCIIFVAKTKRPVDDILIRADDKNSNGIGLAWRDKGMIKWEKGISIEALLKRVHTDPPEYPYVIHFRSATTGSESKELCHPFVVSSTASTALKGSAKEVMFHNGTWSPWDFKLKENLFHAGKKIPSGPWSDSRALAWHVGTYGREVLRWLSLKNEQRICLFTAKDLQLEGSWSESDGFMHSNPTNPHLQGPINITPKHEYEAKHKKLSRRERRALRAAPKSEQGDTQKLLEAAHNCTVGHTREASWKIPKDADSSDSERKLKEPGYFGEYEDNGEDKAIPDWPTGGWSGVAEEEELPTIDIRFEKLWSLEDIREILLELRIFSWHAFHLVRPKHPLIGVGV